MVQNVGRPRHVAEINQDRFPEEVGNPRKSPEIVVSRAQGRAVLDCDGREVCVGRQVTGSPSRPEEVAKNVPVTRARGEDANGRKVKPLLDYC